MISLSLDSHTTPYFQTSALLTWPSLWSGLTDSAWVQVYAVPRGWYVKANVDLRGRFDQWCYGRPFASLEDAAKEAADLWTEGVRLALALTRGEPLRPPSLVMAEAWEATEDFARLDGARRAAHQVLYDLDVDRPGYEARRREAVEVKDAATEALAVARSEWMRAQDWRGHRDGVEPAVSKPSVVVQEYRQMVLGEVG